MQLQSCIFLHPAILEGVTRKTSQEAEVKSSKWLNRGGTKN